MLERIIQASTNEGDLVFDPFSGSATTGVAAIGLRRGFVGCERDAGTVAVSLRRLERAVAERARGVASTTASRAAGG